MEFSRNAQHKMHRMMRGLPHWAFILLALSLAAAPAPAQTVDTVDPDYGGKIRQLRKDDGHEHNLYYYRDPWNADGSRMVAVQSDLDQKHWRVCLYDGDGGFIKTLFPIEQYNWRVIWDRKQPELLYTLEGATLVRLNVATGKTDKLKSFAPLRLLPCGISINQAGDRILAATSDKVIRSYHLPEMSDERAFKVEIPAGCSLNTDKIHYTGYGNTIDIAWSGAMGQKQAIAVHDDTGKRLHIFDGIGGGGHYDYSPDGKLAYFKLPTGGRGSDRTPFEIHVVNLDGTNDRVLFSLPAQQVHFHNLHLSWPRGVNDWFIASFFPMGSPAPAAATEGQRVRRSEAPAAATASPRSRREGATVVTTSTASTRRTRRVAAASAAAPAGQRTRRAASATTTTAPAGQRTRRAAAPTATATPHGGPDDPSPVDEIVMFKLDGTVKRLAHTGTVYSRAAERGQEGDMFWAQPLGRPSADGKRICFNSNLLGTIDLCILYPEGDIKR